MSKFTNFIITYDEIKAFHSQLVCEINQKIKLNKGYIDSASMINVALARYYLDKIILDQQTLEYKWYQWYVYDHQKKTKVFGGFKGDRKYCEAFIETEKCRNGRKRKLELCYSTPEDLSYSWNNYLMGIRVRGYIKIQRFQ